MDEREPRFLSPGAQHDDESIDTSGTELLKHSHLRLWMAPFPPGTPQAERERGLLTTRHGRIVALALILVVVAWYVRAIILSSF